MFTPPNSKYRWTEPVDFNGTRCYRVQLLKDIDRFGLKAGDFGGLVAANANFSQDGDCWLDFDSVLSAGAVLRDDAYLENSTVTGPITVKGNSVIVDSELQASALQEGVVASAWVMHSTLRGRINISKRSSINSCLMDGAITIKKVSKVKNCVISGPIKIKRSGLSECIINGPTTVDFSDLNSVKVDVGGELLNSDISKCHIKRFGVFDYAQINNDGDFMFIKDDFYDALVTRDDHYHGGAMVSFKRHPLPNRSMPFNDFKAYIESKPEVENSRKMIVEKINQFINSK